MDINEILAKSLEYNKNTDKDLIINAYKFAEKIHSGQKRLSGENYIIHPLNVALILTSMKADSSTIAAGILHDVLEDSDTKIDVLEKKFGSDIALMVDAVTKISKLKLPESYEEESLKKMILAGAKDIRVLFIKLADRLHNMRTLRYLKPEKQKILGRECIEIYGPLAYRLGLTEIKNEIEDLGLKYYLPEEFKKIVEGLNERKESRENRTKQIINEIKLKLDENNIKYEVFGRAKHLYSIYRKIKLKNYDINKMYDLAALRVITSNVKDCYEVLRIIQSMWRTIPGTFKDYVVKPKPNGYQSIHLSVIVGDGKPVEFQIRTKEMDGFYEKGAASHWRYKGDSLGDDFDKKVAWLKEVLDIQRESAKEFVKDMKVDFFSESLFVFTPKNETKELPVGSTVLDFAYSIHSRLGDCCTGAYLNGKYVGIKHVLSNGDIVEVVTSKNQNPSIEWLKSVKTSKARNYIRRAIRVQGKIPTAVSNVAKEEVKEFKDSFVHIIGVNDPKIKFAFCCKPLPGDKIVGFMASYKRVSVHKVNCRELKKQNMKKNIKAGWLENFDSDVVLKVRCHDRIGIFAEILNSISKLNFNIKKASAKVLNKDQGLCSFSIEVKSLENLCDLIERLQKIKDVTKVYIG